MTVSTTCRFSRQRGQKADCDERPPSAVEKMLLAMHPDELSPKAALEKLYELKALAETVKKTKS